MAINVTYDEMEVPKSPFKVNATPGCDANRVKAYGPGRYSKSSKSYCPLHVWNAY